MTVERNLDSNSLLGRTPDSLLRRPPSRPFARPRCIFKPLDGYVIYISVNDANRKRIFYQPPKTPDFLTPFLI